jgi:hypothetical protein
MVFSTSHPQITPITTSNFLHQQVGDNGKSSQCHQISSVPASSILGDLKRVIRAGSGSLWRSAVSTDGVWHGGVWRSGLGSNVDWVCGIGGFGAGSSDGDSDSVVLADRRSISGHWWRVGLGFGVLFWYRIGVNCIVWRRYGIGMGAARGRVWNRWVRVVIVVVGHCRWVIILIIIVILILIVIIRHAIRGRGWVAWWIVFHG